MLTQFLSKVETLGWNLGEARVAIYVLIILI